MVSSSGPTPSYGLQPLVSRPPYISGLSSSIWPPSPSRALSIADDSSNFFTRGDKAVPLACVTQADFMSGTGQREQEYGSHQGQDDIISP